MKSFFNGVGTAMILMAVGGIVAQTVAIIAFAEPNNALWAQKMVLLMTRSISLAITGIGLLLIPIAYNKIR